MTRRLWIGLLLAIALMSPWFAVAQEDAEYSSPASVTHGESERYDTYEGHLVGAETVGDETRAMVGTAVHIEDTSFVVQLAVVAVRDGSTLHTFVGWAEYDPPLDEVLVIAKRVLGLEPLEFAPVLDVGYTTGGLYDLLPRIEHLPQGMTWSYDFAPCVGVFGASPCPDLATPLAATPEVTG